mgnify:CR=1 FL=1
MVVKRQDAWTADDDMVLAEVILRHIREGGTQLSAFEEVAEKLGRTPAACGFRWNSTVRKKYKAAIELAKEQRQKRMKEKRHKPPTALSTSTASDSIQSIDQVIRFLKQCKKELKELKRSQKQLESELKKREAEVEELEKENQHMKSQLNHVKTDYQLVNDDYRTLVQIMERARTIAFQGKDDNETNPQSFQHKESKREFEKDENEKQTLK